MGDIQLPTALMMFKCQKVYRIGEKTLLHGNASRICQLSYPLPKPHSPSSRESEVLEGYYGRGKIRTQNSATWVRLEEMERPILSSILSQYVDKSPTIETEEVDHPRCPKSKHSSKGFKQATWTKRQNTKEGDRDVQVKKKGNI